MSDSLTGCPTAQTMHANARARSKLKSGPAIATIILSSAEISGSFARSTSTLPSMMSIGASCGSATKPPHGIEPRLRNGTMAVHHFFDCLPNSPEGNPLGEERGDRDLIARIQNCRQSPADFTGATRQTKRGKIIVTRCGEFELRQFPEIERR